LNAYFYGRTRGTIAPLLTNYAMTILTVNVGSSSVRLSAYSADGVRVASARYVDLERTIGDQLADFLRMHGVSGVVSIGHRIVHGRMRLTASCRITPAVEAEIDDLAVLAPLHNPRALGWVRACRQALGESMTQVAVFDTAYYSELPTVAREYALPHALSQRLALRRYGFHGLAHQSMWRCWSELSGQSAGRVISLQLGAGCSATASRDGQAIDTSMGFSPLEGLVMGTRSGDVDPGALLYIQRQQGISVGRVISPASSVPSSDSATARCCSMRGGGYCK
jgi:acetate kinase